MRITNQMSTNKVLLNINRNAARVDRLYSKASTGKKIQVPSDDPIIAARALKFRTNISETEQYMRNTSQGMSWMRVTEEGFSNTLTLVENLRSRLVQGASDSFTYQDRNKIITEMRSFAEQIAGEMNITYAGRYVFSGYRTNCPPVLNNDEPNADFDITQTFKLSDIQRTSAYVKSPVGSSPTVDVVNVFKIDLPYDNVTMLGTPPELTAGGNTYEIVVTDPTDPSYADRYKTEAGKINYIAETGELIFSEDVVKELRIYNPSELSVEYNKKGLLAGELNPIVYFDCTDNVEGKSYSMSNQTLKFEFSVNTLIQVNSLAKDTYSATLYGEIMNFIDMAEKVGVYSESELRAFYDDGTRTEEQIAEAVREHLSEETKLYTDFLHKSFNNMLGRIEEHNSQALKEYTLLGSRLNRLELINSRLEENRVSYTTLMSENENIDYLEVIMQLNATEAVYTASMQIGANISQITLADYVR